MTLPRFMPCLAVRFVSRFVIDECATERHAVLRFDADAENALADRETNRRTRLDDFLDDRCGGWLGGHRVVPYVRRLYAHYLSANLRAVNNYFACM